MEPCPEDCEGQRYPTFPYQEGAEGVLSTALPIILSAMVVVLSWLAGRFIDKIEVSTHGGMPRAKSGNFAALKRCSSNDKDFHSSRGGPMSAASVQELEGISVVDDEGRLYNETYRSEHSRDDGERYDALGDSPGAQGPSSQGPRSPSVYSQFSQSVFSQSAYGPSAYGPSQRRPSGNGLLGMPGSQIGSSTYDVTSSHAGSGASHYAGPVPSNLGVGASLRSADQTSVSGGGSVVLGYTANNINNHHYSYGNALLGRSVGSGPVGSGPLGSIAGGSAGRRGSGPVAAPPYNPNALPAAAGVNGRLSAGGTGPTRISAGGYRVSTGGGGNAAGAIGANFPGANRGSPPPYSQAQATGMAAPPSVLPREPRPSVDPYLQPPLVQDNGQRRSRSGGEWGQTTGLGAALPAAGGAVVASAAPRVSGDGGEPARGLSDSHRPDLQVRAPAMRAGPRSGFGSDSEYDGGLGTPSTFRA